MAIAAMPGDAPRYYSHPNYANSPFPQVASVNGVVNRSETIRRARLCHCHAADGRVRGASSRRCCPTGCSRASRPGTRPHLGVSLCHDLRRRPACSTPTCCGPRPTPNEYTVVFDSGLLTVPALTDPARRGRHVRGAGLAVQAGDLLAFYGQGIPVDIDAGTDVLSYPAPTQPLQGTTITLGSADSRSSRRRAPTPSRAQVIDLSGSNVVIAGGIRKFVDGLPGLGAGRREQPRASTSRSPSRHRRPTPGSDYYEIELVAVHGADALGPAAHDSCAATGRLNAPGGPDRRSSPLPGAGDRRARRTARCGSCSATCCPTGAGGNLFLPVDTTVMGSGMGRRPWMMAWRRWTRRTRCAAMPTRR